MQGFNNFGGVSTQLNHATGNTGGGSTNTVNTGNGHTMQNGVPPVSQNQGVVDTKHKQFPNEKTKTGEIYLKKSFSVKLYITIIN